MNIDITSLFPDLEALTPDGRWAMLQDWLSKNPEYGERAERWSTQPQAKVFNEIRDLAVKKYGPLAAIVLGSALMESKIRTAIETLQACYRERNNQPEKEIKNAGQIKPSKKSRRAGTAKRTAQDRD